MSNYILICNNYVVVARGRARIMLSLLAVTSTYTKFMYRGIHQRLHFRDVYNYTNSDLRSWIALSLSGLVTIPRP